MRHIILPSCTLLCLCVMSHSAAAQELGWSYTLSVGAESEPTYVGSDSNVTALSYGAVAQYTASAHLQWILAFGGLGVRYRINDSSAITASLEYEPGRDSDDDTILEPFDAIEDTWEIQAMYLHEVGPIDVGVGFQQDLLGKGKGLVGFLGAQYDHDVTDRLSFNTSLALSFADAEHMNTEVGISNAVSLASGLAPYTTEGGYKSTTLTAGIDYLITDNATVYSAMSIEQYGSKIADSPLVSQVGNDMTTSIEVGLRYSF